LFAAVNLTILYQLKKEITEADLEVRQTTA